MHLAHTYWRTLCCQQSAWQSVTLLFIYLDVLLSSLERWATDTWRCVIFIFERSYYDILITTQLNHFYIFLNDSIMITTHNHRRKCILSPSNLLLRLLLCTKSYVSYVSCTSYIYVFTKLVWMHHQQTQQMIRKRLSAWSTIQEAWIRKLERVYSLRRSGLLNK